MRFFAIALFLLSACSHQHSDDHVSVPVETWTKTAVTFDLKIAAGPMSFKQTKNIKEYCNKLEQSFERYGWGKSDCASLPWTWQELSHDGDPLIYAIWSDLDPDPKKPITTTLIMCGVHGDEITPVKFCFDAINMLKDVSKATPEFRENFRNKRVVVAPLVSPDSYFKRYPSRTNARGVDINRNFPTKDWSKDALRLWAHRYGKDKRRYPGPMAASETETLFQVELIDQFTPGKIISVHSPLTMLDYDGPEDFQTGGEVGNKASQLLIQMSRKASGYRIKNYPFFPGSLGNYAGNERGIPTFTLELPSSDNRRHREYWQQFKGAIRAAIIQELTVDYGVAGEANTTEEATLN